MNDEDLDSWTLDSRCREFQEILLAHEIQTLVDVRTFPSSRRFPQFNQEAVERIVASIGINYHHAPRLGGRRKPAKIRTILPGRTPNFVVTPITWKPKSSNMEFKNYLKSSGSPNCDYVCGSTLVEMSSEFDLGLLESNRIAVIHIVDAEEDGSSSVHVSGKDRRWRVVLSRIVVTENEVSCKGQRRKGKIKRAVIEGRLCIFAPLRELQLTSLLGCCARPFSSRPSCVASRQCGGEFFSDRQ